MEITFLAAFLPMLFVSAVVFTKIEDIHLTSSKKIMVGLLLIVGILESYFFAQEDVQYVQYCVVFFILFLSVIQDVMNQKLPLIYYVIALPQLMMRIRWFDKGSMNYLGVFMFVVILLILVFCQVAIKVLSMGDVILFTLLCCILGVNIGVQILFVGLMLVGLYGLLIFPLGIGNRKTRVPFAPYLLLGYMLIFMLNNKFEYRW